MMKIRGSLVFCATICTVIVLALLVSAFTYGPFSLRMLSHGPNPPPDDDMGGGGGIVAHGPNPPPDDDMGGGGGIVAHGPNPPPDDDMGGGGGLRLA